MPNCFCINICTTLSKNICNSNLSVSFFTAIIAVLVHHTEMYQFGENNFVSKRHRDVQLHSAFTVTLSRSVSLLYGVDLFINILY